MKTKLLLLLLLANFSIYAQINLVPDGGLESWSGGKPYVWAFENAVSINTDAAVGNYSANLSYTSAALSPKIITKVPLKAGVTYTVKFRYKYITSNYNGSHPIALNISANGSANNLSSSTFATNNLWTERENTFTADIDLTYDLSLSTFSFDGEIFNVLIDDVKVYIKGTEQYTLIPDVEFEKKLISLGIDSGTPDGKVLTSNAANVVSLDLDTNVISDLTGIQDFTALQTLYCYGTPNYQTNVGNGKLTSLDISNNLKLINLQCDNNQITSLNLSKNTELNMLSFTANKLTTIDLTNNTKLTKIYCYKNQLTGLDVSKAPKLEGLYGYQNKITKLDLSSNPALNYVDVSSNNLLTLNLKNGTNTLLKSGRIMLSGNSNLYCVAVDDVAYAVTTWKSKDPEAVFYPFECSVMTPILDAAFEQKLIDLNIDTDGKNGAVLNSSIAAITSLDVSNSSITNLSGIEGFTGLTALNCSGNLLKKLDVSRNQSLNTLNTANNPSLKCIKVADLAAAANWTTTKDAAASFNLSCDFYTLIPDSKFEDKLIALGIDRDGKNGKVNTERIEEITSLDLFSQGITDLTGIEGFKALKTLNCNFNAIEKLDVSQNTSLTNLSLRFNKLSKLDLSNNVMLTDLDVYSNNLTVLDLSANKALTNLVCSTNKLTAVDISNNLNLKRFECASNPINTLNVSKHAALEYLVCDRTGLKTLDVSQNKALTALKCAVNNISSIDVSANLNLTTLDCSSNGMKSLDVKKNTNLTLLDCSGNELQSLDVTSNTALQYLVCGNNGNKGNIIKSIDISKNINLLELNASQLSLTDLNISQNTALKQLHCGGNAITSLDLSTNTALENIVASSNKITALDVSNNKLLKNLVFDGNQITSLDVSKNTALIFVSASSNNLTSLNLKNGNNSKFLTNNGIYFRYFEGSAGSTYYSSFKKNVNLACIKVDDAAYSKTNWSAIKDTEADFTSLDCGLSTLITDSKFEEKLIALGIDIDGKNGAVLNSSINTVTSLDVANSSITDLSGIQGFTALKTLNVSNNLISSLDLSKNTVLNTLNVSNNPSLTCIRVADLAAAANWTVTKDAGVSFSLDCNAYTLIPDPKFEEYLINAAIDRDGKNGKVKTESIAKITNLSISSLGISDLTGIEDFKSLEQLSVYNNSLTSLDLSKNTTLTYLNASANKLESINISKSAALISLDLNSNKLAAIDLAGNINLQSIQFSSNKLKGLDLTKNLKLTTLSASNNELLTLDVSSNTELTLIWVGSNQLRSFDVSKNTKLTSLDVSINKLVNLNVKNGTNPNTSVNFVNNRDLTCIQVDDVAFSNTNWASKKDASALYSSDPCPVVVPYTPIPDPKFEEKLIALGIDTDGKNGKVATMNIVALTSLNVSNSGITDLTGIEYFTSLTSLECNNNALTTINISNNFSLTNLNISNNKLSSLPFSQNLLLLTNLNCSNNEVTTLELSRNTNLSVLNASFNKLQNLDVSKNTRLKELHCASNDLYNLNLKNGNNANMQNMIFGNFTKNPNLLCIQVDDPAYSNDKWIAKDATAAYSSDPCAPNYKYTLIPDPNFERRLISQGLDSGPVDGKVLTSNISNVTSLSAFGQPDKIKDLTGIEDFTNLEYLYFYHEAVEKIDLSKNLKLKHLDMADNKVTTLDLSKNTALETVDCSYNGLTELNVSNNPALKILLVTSNLLTDIDVSKNTELTRLDIGSNKITSLDVAANTNLTMLAPYNNKIASLDITNNLALTSLDAYSTLLTTINVSKNTALTYLNIKNSQLTAIDVTANKALTSLDISGNKIETLDVSQNAALTVLRANSNLLTSLNLKNGTNTLLTNANVSFSLNPKLYCILVDDTMYAKTNWSNRKDDIAVFNTECTGELILPVNNFSVETKGESCLGENNGEISITAKGSFAYAATINDKTYTFTDNSLKVTALTPGVYKIKITIPEMIFEQNFTVNIQKAATITGKSTITSKKASIEITAGTAPYTVYIDGTEQFQTTDSNFNLELEKGGLIEVATAKACEGIFSKKVTALEAGGVLTAYPNPTSGSFEIEIPTNKTEVKIELYNFAGQLVSNKNYTIENGKAQLNLESQASGIYAAKIYLETPEYLKIIKK